MPGINGTGPMGMGPMTGRGMGRCNGSFSFAGGRGNIGRGRGFGCNFGRGFRRGAGYTSAYDEQDLSSYERYLEDELKYVREQKNINK